MHDPHTRWTWTKHYDMEFRCNGMVLVPNFWYGLKYHKGNYTTNFWSSLRADYVRCSTFLPTKCSCFNNTFSLVRHVMIQAPSQGGLLTREVNYLSNLLMHHDEPSYWGSILGGCAHGLAWLGQTGDLDHFPFTVSPKLHIIIMWQTHGVLLSFVSCYHLAVSPPFVLYIFQFFLLDCGCPPRKAVSNGEPRPSWYLWCVESSDFEWIWLKQAIGAMLIGGFITMSIYGITTLQVRCFSPRSAFSIILNMGHQSYYYYISYPKDGAPLKVLVSYSISSWWKYPNLYF